MDIDGAYVVLDTHDGKYAGPYDTLVDVAKAYPSVFLADVSSAEESRRYFLAVVQT